VYTGAVQLAFSEEDPALVKVIPVGVPGLLPPLLETITGKIGIMESNLQ
jgi:hypothetical protein